MQTISTDLNNIVVRWIVPLVGSVLASWATIWLLQTVNPLAAFCFLGTMIMVVVAIVAPRVGLFLLLALCFFSDLIKRLLVIFGDLDFDQVSYVLMAAPAVVVALLFSIATQRAFHHTRFTASDLVLAVVSMIMAVANFALTLRGGGSILEAAKDAVNMGLYAAAAIISMRAFQDEEGIEKFLRAMVILFVPVALYGFWQLKFGFADYEVAYLRSGLSIEIKQLFDLRPRPFSTLNSAGVFGTLSAGVAVIALYPRLAARYRPLRKGEAVGSILLSLLFLASAFGSLVRSSHIVWVVAGIGFLFFSSRRGTIIFYALAVGGLLTLIFSAPFLLEHIGDLDPAQFASSDYAVAVLTIGTYSDRLVGFINLTHAPEMWSLFGLTEAQKGMPTTIAHDPIGQTLISYGVVGLISAIAILSWALTWLHRKLLAMPPGRARVLAMTLISTLLGWLWAEILVKGVITTFPLNALFWLFVGFLGFLVTKSHDAPEGATQSGETDPSKALASRPAWAGEVPKEPSVQRPRAVEVRSPRHLR